MVRHVVMFRFPDGEQGAEKAENLKKIKELLETLPSKIKEIKYYEVGIGKQMTPSSCDLCLISSFENWADLDVYRNHPEHKKALEFINSFEKEVFASDYEYVA